MESVLFLQEILIVKKEFRNRAFAMLYQRNNRLNWRKDGKRVMTVGSGKSVTEIVIGSVKIKKRRKNEN